MKLENHADVMDLLTLSYGQPGLILDEAQLGPHFFDLKTGLAGEGFQKFTNYQRKLALVVSDRTIYGKRLQELADEHDRHPAIRFFPDRLSAAEWLAQQDQ